MTVTYYWTNYIGSLLCVSCEEVICGRSGTLNILFYIPFSILQDKVIKQTIKSNL